MEMNVAINAERDRLTDRGAVIDLKDKTCLVVRM